MDDRRLTFISGFPVAAGLEDLSSQYSIRSEPQYSADPLFPLQDWLGGRRLPAAGRIVLVEAVGESAEQVAAVDGVAFGPLPGGAKRAEHAQLADPFLADQLLARTQLPQRVRPELVKRAGRACPRTA